MKKSKQFMLMLLSLALVVSVCMSVFVACDDKGDDNKPEYTITIGTYDTDKGTITLDSEKVKQGSEVTVTVEAKGGWEIKSFYIGNSDMTQQFYNANNMNTSKDYTKGTYKFVVNKDNTVRAEFQEKGINSNTDYIYTLSTDFDSEKCDVTVSPDRNKFASNEAISLNIELNADYKIVSLLINGKEQKSELVGSGISYSYTFNITANTTIVVDVQYDTTVIKNFTSTVTEEEFNKAINSNRLVLCDFWAHDCDPCIYYMAPSLERLAGKGEMADVRIIKVQLTSRFESSSNAYKLKNQYAKQLGSDGGFPFVVLFKNGEPVGYFNGAFTDQATQDNSVINFVKKYK